MQMYPWNKCKCIPDCIPGILEITFQGMLEDIGTREKVAHSSYKEMEELDFQILLTDNYSINTNSVHLCFRMKIKKIHQ